MEAKKKSMVMSEPAQVLRPGHGRRERTYPAGSIVQTVRRKICTLRPALMEAKIKLNSTATAQAAQALRADRGWLVEGRRRA